MIRGFPSQLRRRLPNTRRWRFPVGTHQCGKGLRQKRRRPRIIGSLWKPPHLPPLYLLNVKTQARRAGDKGGRVTITARLRQPSSAKVPVSALRGELEDRRRRRGNINVRRHRNQSTQNDLPLVCSVIAGGSGGYICCHSRRHSKAFSLPGRRHKGHPSSARPSQRRAGRVNRCRAVPRRRD